MNRFIKFSSFSFAMLLFTFTASAQIIKRTEAPKKVEQKKQEDVKIFGERKDEKKVAKAHKTNRRNDKHPNWKKGHKKQVKKKHPVFTKHPGRGKQIKRRK